VTTNFPFSMYRYHLLLQEGNVCKRLTVNSPASSAAARIWFTYHRARLQHCLASESPGEKELIWRSRLSNVRNISMVYSGFLALVVFGLGLPSSIYLRLYDGSRTYDSSKTDSCDLKR
jgi:hypothetical protein